MQDKPSLKKITSHAPPKTTRCAELSSHSPECCAVTRIAPFLLPSEIPTYQGHDLTTMRSPDAPAIRWHVACGQVLPLDEIGKFHKKKETTVKQGAFPLLACVLATGIPMVVRLDAEAGRGATDPAPDQGRIFPVRAKLLHSLPSIIHHPASRRTRRHRPCT
jgi:hypothetical protein